ncbi:MAG: MCE family protein [Flavipsychrobacter sp.]|nr:MCE family protein [Flavipsychrobacter sp.]
MKNKNRGRIGTVTTIALIVAGIVVYNKYLRSKPNEYIAFYNTVKGLQASSPVLIKGVRVGKIKSIEILPDGIVKVTMLLNDELQIPDSSKAMLMSAGVLSDKTISIVLADNDHYMLPGDTLLSEMDNSTMNASAQVAPFTETAKYLLYSTDTTLRDINHQLQNGLMKSFVLPLADFEKSMHKYEGLSASYNSKGDSIAKTINSISNSTANMAKDSRSWGKSISNIQTQTKELADKDMRQQLSSIRSNIKKLNTTVTDVTKPGGDVHKLAIDKATYTSAALQLDTANQSMKELKENPPGFSILGKSKKKK